MIIEFFGFPGSGKSTITNEVLNKLETEGIMVCRGTFDHHHLVTRVSLKVVYSFLCLFFNYNFFVLNMRKFIVFNRSKFSFRDFLNVTYLYSRYWIFKDSKKIILFDQGLCQAYLSILTFKDNVNYDIKVFNGLLDTIVFLELDYEENLKRLTDRNNNQSRSQNNNQNINDYYDKFIRVNEIIKSLNYTDNIVLNSSESVSKNAEILIRTLDNKFNT